MKTRRVTLIALALVSGIVIGLIDSSPGWDSTGITAAAVCLAAAVYAGVARDRPWLWALLIGLPTVVLDIARSGTTGSVLALGLATLGATVGWAVRRAG